MTGTELKNFRRSLSMSTTVFGIYFGYKGNPLNVSTQVREMERERRPVPEWLEVAIVNYLEKRDV